MDTTTIPRSRPQAPPRQPRRPEPARPVSSPRHTRPAPPREERPPVRATRRRQQRMPFILLLVGLLGGALISLLVISTTLDAGAYRINNLTTENAVLSKNIQVVKQQVAIAQNPATIEQEAYQLGMRRNKGLRFINTKTGKISYSPPVKP